MRGELHRRGFLRGTAGAFGAAAMAPPALWPGDAGVRTARAKFRELDARIAAGMEKYHIPGAAVGVRYQGHVHLRGFGVTNSRYPVRVDPDTLFQIGSITKTFTGTAVMRLVDQGLADLDAEVRRYLPDVRLPPGTEAVTVRELLNHTAGWLPQVFTNYGRGADALRQYVAALPGVPVLTRPGTVFNYGASAIALAGYLVERLAGKTYEFAMQDLLLRPLGLRHTFFFTDEIIGYNVCAPHVVTRGKAEPVPPDWYLPRSVNPAGASLVCSAADLLRYARFQLGDGRAPDGTRLLSPAAMTEMHSHPGPGGTDMVELLGAGISWPIRPTAQGVRILQHGGDTNAMRSNLLLVPAQDFAMILLTNSASAGLLVMELFCKDWAIRLFTGLTNPPARERRLSPAELAPFPGRYVFREIGTDGRMKEDRRTVTAHGGGLRIVPGVLSAADLLTFYESPYGPDYVLDKDDRGVPTGYRFDFVRDPAGHVAWLRINGGLYRHET